MTIHPPVLALPQLPTIGEPESYYVRNAHDAEKAHDHHAHEAWKAAQYITLALNPKLKWPEKLKYFQHALHRHCLAPQIADQHVWEFYDRLGDLVREHCGKEALRLASAEDDVLAKWQKMGCSQERIDEQAQTFFDMLLCHYGHCPDYFSEEDWLQLTLFRDAWV